MNTTFTRHLAALALCLGLSGCISPYEAGFDAAERKLSADTIAQIKKGVTTEDGVKTILGSSPDSEMVLPDGSRMMLYDYIEPKDAKPLLSPFGLAGPGSAVLKTKMLRIDIGANGIVEDYSITWDRPGQPTA